MLTLTKIFHFEMAHAIQGYPGACRNVHGHSYELHVTVSGSGTHPGYIPAPGFITDFKAIKQIVTNVVLSELDHKLVLSGEFISLHPLYSSQENLVTWEAEPTAENILIFIQKTLCERLPRETTLLHLKLYETKDSYAEWINENTFRDK